MGWVSLFGAKRHAGWGLVVSCDRPGLSIGGDEIGLVLFQEVLLCITPGQVCIVDIMDESIEVR